MEAYFMGIDTGTQGVRIGISDTGGKLIFEQEQKWETEFPKVGWAEQNQWKVKSDRTSEPVVYVLLPPLQ